MLARIVRPFIFALSFTAGSLLAQGELGDLDGIDIGPDAPPGPRPGASPGPPGPGPNPRDLGGSRDLNSLNGNDLPAELPPSSPQALGNRRELREYRIRELIDATLENNLEIRAQSMAINAAHYEWRYAKAQNLPTVTSSTAYRVSNEENRLDLLKPLTPLDQQFFSIFDTNSVISGVTATVPIYEGHRLDILPKLANSKEKIEIFRREVLKQELEAQLVENYLDYLLEEKELRLANGKLRQKESKLRNIRAQVTSDVALSQGVLTVELEMDDIRQEILEHGNQLVLLQEKIAKLAGLARGLQFRLSDQIQMREITQSVEDILQDSVKENPKIKALEEATVLSDREIQRVRAQKDLGLDLLLDYKHHVFLPQDRFNADVFFAYLKFSYDLYEGNRNQHLRHKEHAVSDKTHFELDNAKQDLETQVRQVHNKYVEAMKLMARAMRAIDLARENMRLVRDKVAANLMLETDLLEAQVNVDRANVFKDRVLTAIIKSRTRLFQLMGRLAPAIYR